MTVEPARPIPTLLPPEAKISLKKSKIINSINTEGEVTNIRGVGGRILRLGKSFMWRS